MFLVYNSNIIKKRGKESGSDASLVRNVLERIRDELTFAPRR